MNEHSTKDFLKIYCIFHNTIETTLIYSIAYVGCRRHLAVYYSCTAII